MEKSLEIIMGDAQLEYRKLIFFLSVDERHHNTEWKTIMFEEENEKQSSNSNEIHVNAPHR